MEKDFVKVSKIMDCVLDDILIATITYLEECKRVGTTDEDRELYKKFQNLYKSAKRLRGRF